MRSKPGEGRPVADPREVSHEPPLTPDPSPPRGEGNRPARRDLIPVVALALFCLFALAQAVAANTLPDFFIYRTGAAIGLRGESPYDPEKIRGAVAARFPDNETLIANCGFFLPPQAVVVFAPFAAVPEPVARVLWAVTLGASAAGVLLLPRVFGGRPSGSLAARLLPVFLLLNFLALGIVIVGQTTLLCVGCVAAGQWCFERKRPALGALLWAVPFVKPHVALPLLPLAWYLGGWRRAAAVAGAVAGLNLAGCLIAGGSPLFFRDYLEFLGSAHKAVAFNLARENYEITSWNRLLYVMTKPFAGDRFLVEQTARVTLAGYLVWFGLVLGRCAVFGKRPSPAWAAAAAAAGAVVCPQVLGYEALMLAVAVPWVEELFAAGWKARGWAAVVVLGMQAIPFQTLDAVGFDFHRPLGVMLFAVLVLLGPVNPASRERERPGSGLTLSP